ncbi:uncharacterized protein LOC129599391 [Paramacrobiotus metropolitanus]|uniref:uncharacterized protein LOC129599391 n=1 Tax=Paramacrobiotus metropolitanus TaxID=2943436 RepID=UPI002445B6E3|nr:uncharacterized protein LOC129599391 [Paramacrobiotus metropolitanus]
MLLDLSTIYPFALLTLSAALLFRAAADEIRVDIRILDFANKASVLADGATKCKANMCQANQPPCDVQLKRAMNTSVCPKSSEECFTPTTADLNSVEWWPVYFEQCVDQASINRTFSQDTCNGKFKQINMAVKAYHQGYFTSNKDMQYFDCKTSAEAKDVASNLNAAKWSKPFPCDQKFKNPANAKLTYQWRAYQIPKEQCGTNAKKAAAETSEQAAKKNAKEAEEQRLKKQEDDATKRGLAKLVAGARVIVQTIPADGSSQEKATRSALLDLFSKNFGTRYRTESLTIKLLSRDKEEMYYLIKGYSVPVDKKTISTEFVDLIKSSKIPNVVNACYESKECKKKV